ncbi:conjugal transfer protein TrbI, partial [Xylella fastidiosa subsp. multiplex]|nr:conjugal transfer protein TrbI [Xylella fastidiosa subsp. multiplex]
KNIDTRTMANEVLSGHGPGLIPSAMPEVPPAVSGTAGIPIAPVNNPDAPPMPPHQPDSLSAPVNPDEQQLRMAKLQQFQEAIKANSKITLPYDGSGSGSTSMTSRGASATATPQSHEEMLAQ